jgi:phospholipid/cholesterol/gamma-HCH transport system substrate-binding protein
MRENLTETLIGAAILAGAAAFLIYAAQSTGFNQSTEGYPLRASFRSAEGVSIGTDVRLAGVKIGTVTGMDLNPETYRADTTLTVVPNVGIPNDSTAVVSSEGLLGGNFVEIMPGGALENFAPGDAFTDTQGAVSLITLLAKFASGSGGDGSQQP